MLPNPFYITSVIIAIMERDTWIIALWIVVVFVLLTGCMMNTSNQENVEQVPAPAPSPTPAPSFLTDYQNYQTPNSQTDVIERAQQTTINVQQTPRKDVTILSHRYVDEGRLLKTYHGKIIGTAQNTGTEPVDAFIRAKFFDDKGVIIDTGIDSIDDLVPGETWEFELTFIGDRPPARYQIYVSGLY